MMLQCMRFPSRSFGRARVVEVLAGVARSQKVRVGRIDTGGELRVPKTPKGICILICWRIQESLHVSITTNDPLDNEKRFYSG